MLKSLDNFKKYGLIISMKWGSFLNFLTKSNKRKIFFLFMVVLSFIYLIILRRVDSVSNPQFWAEDGVFWFAEAYDSADGLDPFMVPKQGYYQTFSRIGGFVSQMFPMEKAPLILNIFAIFAEAIPAIFFLSSRFNKIVPKRSARILVGFLYIVLPATIETHLNITNSQWRLAILSFLIIVSSPSKKIAWNVFDWFFLFLGGLSGPFIFFLFPLFAIYCKIKTFKGKIIAFGISAVSFLLQLYSFLFIHVTGATRSEAPLGANFLNFFKIFSGKILFSGTFGAEGYVDIKSLSIWKLGLLPIFFGVLGIIILVYSFKKSFLELRLFFIFSILILIAFLVSPQVSMEGEQWKIMLGRNSGNRYFFIPILSWILAVTWLFFNEKKFFLKAIIGFLFFCFLFIGVPRDFFFKPYKDYSFSKQVEEFKKIPTGQEFIFKINPNWEMKLTKK